MSVLFRQADGSNVLLEVLQLPACHTFFASRVIPSTVTDRYGTCLYLPTWHTPLFNMAQGALPTWHTPSLTDVAQAVIYQHGTHLYLST